MLTELILAGETNEKQTTPDDFTHFDVMMGGSPFSFFGRWKCISLTIVPGD